MLKTFIAFLILSLFSGDGWTSGVASGTILSIYDLPKASQYNSYPYDANFLDNGNILVTNMHGNGKNRGNVMELNPDCLTGIGGDVIWEFNDTTKLCAAERHANGNTLVTAAHEDGGRIFEVDGAGNEVVEWYNGNDHGGDCAVDADLLPDGNLLVTMRYSDDVFIVDKADPTNKIWEYNTDDYGYGGDPLDADLLPNGNILITCKNSGKIIEVDPITKETVWEISGYDNPYDAERLPNGHTIICEAKGYDHTDITDNGRISEVDENGVEVGEFMFGLARPHAIDYVLRDNGDLDVLIADTGAGNYKNGNRIILIRGWSDMGSTPPTPSAPPPIRLLR